MSISRDLAQFFEGVSRILDSIDLSKIYQGYDNQGTMSLEPPLSNYNNLSPEQLDLMEIFDPRKAKAIRELAIGL